MSKSQEVVELRRAVSSRASTPATSPRAAQPRQAGTPRKLGRHPNATPNPGGTPGAARTPSLRGRTGIPPLPLGSRLDRARAPRGCNGAPSEPGSPRCSISGRLEHGGLHGLGDSLEDLLPPGDDAGPAASADNVSVFVRVRPLNSRERESGGAAARTCVSCPPGGRVVVLGEGGRLDPLSAAFDRVFGPEEGQEEVFATVGAQMVDNCMAGINSSLFVYGQTGAGKTHTITGAADGGGDGSLDAACGLTLRVFTQLFQRIAQEEGERVRYTVKCYNCEVYGEEVSDLLCPGSTGLQIRDGDQQQGIYVEGLSEHAVVNADDVVRLLRCGAANRHTAATRMNEGSSRSHSVFTAVVQAHEEQAESGVTRVTFAKLNLIDLAGSERVGRSGATGDRLAEAKGINKSLTTLGRVVSALTERQQHIPYRDSKLTFLLKESLGGNAKTSIIACVSPSEESAQETHSTLVFAAGAKKIRNKAVVNRDTLGDMRALQLENARLQRELAKREDVLAADLRQQLAAAQASEAAAVDRVAAAEERQQQLEAALNDRHSALQQRNAELSLVRQEVGEARATCDLLQKDREELIDHNAALAERVDSLQDALQGCRDTLRTAQQDSAAALERCEAALSLQRAAEDAARALQHDKDRLAADVARATADLGKAEEALEESERSKKALRREVEQLLSDLRRRQRELSDTQELASAREERLRGEAGQLTEALAGRSAQLKELEAKLAAEAVCTAKYRRMVGEIGKLIDWAQSTSPLPPTLGGRTSPAGYSSLLAYGGSTRLSFGGGVPPVSPLGEATNQRGAPGSAARRTSSPVKRLVQVPSPAGRSPIPSPSKFR